MCVCVGKLNLMTFVNINVSACLSHFPWSFDSQEDTRDGE